MTVLSWIAVTLVMAWTGVMFIHIGKIHRAFRNDDQLMVLALCNTTMRLVGIWQIVLGVAMIFMGPDPAWMPAITLIMVGLAIVGLDYARRKFDLISQLPKS